jgi:transcriptional regulator with XRE-family HTH domain
VGTIEDVGQRIAELRRANGWTQEECAVRLRLTVRRLRRFETGMNLTVRTLERIAKGLGVPIGALFEPPQSNAPRTRGRPRKTPGAPYPDAPGPRDGASSLLNPIKRPKRRKPGAK